MQIEINLPRSLFTYVALIAVGWALAVWHGGGTMTASVTETASSSSEIEGRRADYVPANVAPDAQGGAVTTRQEKVKQAEEDAKLERMRQDMLSRKVDILRGELRVLEAERTALGDKKDPALETAFVTSESILKSLIQDQKKAEQFLLASLNQIWEAEGKASEIGAGYTGPANVTSLLWPVEPRLGISATFHDSTYKDRFGFEHDAVDVPVSQGSIVHAAADGVVKDVVDHGLGFNYITIQHDGGISTLYGHLTKFSVAMGQHVKAGDAIGFSGGRPGTPGAGLSTGPHVHFGVFKAGIATDPMAFLPPLPTALPAGE